MNDDVVAGEEVDAEDFALSFLKIILGTFVAKSQRSCHILGLLFW